MRHILQIYCLIILLSCNNNPERTQSSQDSPTDHKTNNKVTPGNTDWTASFRKLRDAILNNDRNTIKSFFEFPIRDEGNDIWYVANSKLVITIDAGQTKPFEETDFDRYYYSIIPQDLRKTLEKINLEDLFKKYRSESPEMTVVEGATSRLDVEYDEDKQQLRLSLLSIYKDTETFETAFIYEFDILNGQKLRFREIHVAG